MNETEIKQTAFDSLNNKQKAFVLNYIRNRVSTTAYLEAYSIENTPDNYYTAAAAACRLLKNVKVEAAIQEKFDEIWNEKESDIGKVFDELKSLGFSDINNIMELRDGVLSVRDFDSIDTRAIKKIKIKELKSESTDTRTAEIIEIELHDKKGSLAEIADILKLKKQQVELSGNAVIYLDVQDRDL